MEEDFRIKCIRCDGPNLLANFCREIKICRKCIAEVQTAWEPFIYPVVSRPTNVVGAPKSVSTPHRLLQDKLTDWVTRQVVRVGQVKAVLNIVRAPRIADVPNEILPVLDEALTDIVAANMAFGVPQGVVGSIRDVERGRCLAIKRALSPIVEQGKVTGIFKVTEDEYILTLSHLLGVTKKVAVEVYYEEMGGLIKPVDHQEDPDEHVVPVLRYRPVVEHSSRVCDECGKTFKPYNPQAKRCSANCTAERNRRMAREKARAKVAARLEAEAKMTRGWTPEPVAQQEPVNHT